MDSTAWPSVASGLAGILGGACQPGFSADAAGRQAEWGEWLDHETRQDGVTSEALVEFGQMAEAPLVLVLYLEDPDPNRPRRSLGAGAAAPAPAESAKPKPTPVGAPANAPVAPPALPNGHGHRHRIRTTWEPMPIHTYAIGASLYSVERRDFVAEVGADATMEKKGEAREGFYERLRRLVPHATCANWDWSREKRPPPPSAPSE